ASSSSSLSLSTAPSLPLRRTPLSPRLFSFLSFPIFPAKDTGGNHLPLPLSSLLQPAKRRSQCDSSRRRDSRPSTSEEKQQRHQQGALRPIAGDDTSSNSDSTASDGETANNNSSSQQQAPARLEVVKSGTRRILTDPSRFDFCFNYYQSSNN
ncbi:hypothetical protein AABB24_022913, partial [Solanum stoloniferum]